MMDWSLLNEELAGLMRQGILAFDRGDRQAAYELFSQAVEREGRNVLALLWKAATAPHPQETILCLERALEVDPFNALAQEGLSWTKARLEPREEPPPKAPLAEVESLSPQEAKAELDRLIESSAAASWEPEQVSEAPVAAPQEGLKAEEVPEPSEAPPSELGAPVVAPPQEEPLQELFAPLPATPYEEAEEPSDDLAKWISELTEERRESPPWEEEQPPQEEEAPSPLPSWMEEPPSSPEEEESDWGKRLPPAPHLEIEALPEAAEVSADLQEQAAMHYRQGVSLFEENRLEESIAELRQAIRLVPDHADAHNYAGNALYLLGRTEEAINEYKEALRIQPDHQDAHLNLGIVYKNENRKAEAARELQRYLELDPNSPIRSEVENLIRECQR